MAEIDNKIIDPYVGEVYGNILDMYDSPTYNIRLFMVRRDISDRLTSESIFSTDKLMDPGTELGGGPGTPVANEDIVILAQSGVTGGTYIDDLEIEALANPDVPRQLFFNFSIVQNGAASFMDQILLSKKYLGFDQGVGATLYLEIRFQGYEDDSETQSGDRVEGGTFAVISGPLRWKLQLNDLQLSITGSGSQYQLTCMPVNEYGKRPSIYNSQQDFVTKGKTITEHLKSYESAVNKWHQERPNYEVFDKIFIDTSKLIGVGNQGQADLNQIQDDSLELDQIEEVNRIMNEDWEAESFEELIQTRIDRSETTGTTQEKTFDETGLSVAVGTSIERFVASLLSMNSEMYTKISRKLNPEEVGSEIDKERGFISWFKIDVTATEIGFDEKRGENAYFYTFTPYLYKTARLDMALSREENKINKEEKLSRLAQYKANGSLFKSYNYIFTGLNDQVLDLDISYNNGIALLIPPNDGDVGSYSVSHNVMATASVAEDVNREETGVDSTQTQQLANENSLVDLISALSGSASSIRDDFIAGFSQLTGQDPVDIANALLDESGETSRALVEALDSATLAAAAANFVVNPTQSVPTESPDVNTDNEGNDYSPVFSGYTYSADLLAASGAGADAIDSAVLLEVGYIKVEDAENATEVDQKIDSSADITERGAAATYKLASPKNKIFNTLEAQHAINNTFLVDINLSLRGDPWYLGAPGLDGQSGPDRAMFQRDDNLFWLRLAAPVTYDPDWRDEDSEANSGYWRYDGTSYTFSGIYRMITVVNKFSGGSYTCELNAMRLTGLTEPLDNADTFGQDEDQLEDIVVTATPITTTPTEGP